MLAWLKSERGYWESHDLTADGPIPLSRSAIVYDGVGDQPYTYRIAANVVTVGMGTTDSLESAIAEAEGAILDSSADNVVTHIRWWLR
jgi:hypothetical protein